MELEYYTQFDGVHIVNPEVVPLMFHTRWFGQDSLMKDVCLDVRHRASSAKSAEIVQSRYYALLWANFEINQDTPFRKATFCAMGEIFERQRVFAFLWLNLVNRHNGITLSPVPFGPDGKVQLPDVIGLPEAIYGLIHRNCIEWLTDDLKRSIGLWAGWDVRIDHVLCALQALKIVSNTRTGFTSLPASVLKTIV